MDVNGSLTQEVSEWTRVSYFSQYISLICVNITSVVFCIYLHKTGVKRRNNIYARTHKIKMVLVTTAMLSQGLNIIMLIRDIGINRHFSSFFWTAIWSTFTYVFMVMVSVLELKRGVTSPSLTISIFFLLAREFPYTQVIVFQENLKDTIWITGNVYHICHLVVLAIGFLIVVIIDLGFPERLYLNTSNKKSSLVPMNSGNLISNHCMGWIIPQLFLAQRTNITVKDLYDFPEEDKCQETLEQVFTCQDSSEKVTGRTLMKQILKIILGQILPSFICTIVGYLAKINMFFLLRKIIKLVVDSEGNISEEGIHLSLSLLLSGVIYEFMVFLWFFTSHYAAARLRVITSSLLLSKILCMTSSARQENAQMATTLMSLDVHKISLALTDANVIHLPLTFYPFCFILMWQSVGPSSLVGLLIIIIATMLNTVILNHFIQSRKKKEINVKTKRVSLLRSILSGIKVIKSYAWEKPFMKRISDMRTTERRLLLSTFLLQTTGFAISSLTNTMMLACILSLYMATAAEPRLTADQIFILLAAFSHLSSMGQILSPITTILSQAFVSMKRIEEFLDLDENRPLTNCISRGKILKKDEVPIPLYPIVISNASFSWKTDGFSLQRINLSIKLGELVAIVGKVGSGKTSLLHAILGEMQLAGGQISKWGSIAYMPQEPWILNGTFRENVLLGSEFNTEKYWRTLKACALDQDLESLPSGDMTEIGERGVTLSGGQKHRLSLARAVYSDADIFLIDDPLSAVDAKVASHLLDHVFCDTGILANKTRVLVTHAITCLPRMDRIVLMAKGEIVEIGDYSQIMRHKSLIREVHIKDMSLKGEKVDGKEREKWNEKGGKEHFDANLMTDEMDLSNERSCQSLLTYTKAFGFKWLLAIIFLIGLSVSLNITMNFQISRWTEEWKRNETTAALNNNKNLLLVALYGSAAGIGSTFTVLCMALGCIQAVKLLHRKCLSNVFNAKISFFDTTPFGRILNWFTQDLNDVEEEIPLDLRIFIPNLETVLVLLVSSLWISPWILLAFIIILIPFSLIKRLFSVYVVQVMRLYGVGRSRVYSHFNELVHGVVSIHAYNKEKYFCDSFIKLLEESAKPLWHMAAAKVFVMISTSTLGIILFFIMTITTILNRDNLNPAMAAAVLYTAQASLVCMSRMIQVSTAVEKSMVAVARLASTERITTEQSDETDEKNARNMPLIDGPIVFQNYTARYRSNLECVLKDITCVFQQGAKVGIVGRTGAGKTSLTFALLRMLETTSGEIYINNYDTSNISIHGLRSGITTILQDPVLFDVSLRDNLDPTGEHTDFEIWQVLGQTHLKAHIETLVKELDTHSEGFYEGFSLGQKQLLCLARALLRKSQILILDETTASVDVQTDNMVQEILRSSFKDCTLLTIAHRINTVIDYDRILVMDNGHVIEFDDPNVLLQNTESEFYKLVNSAS